METEAAILESILQYVSVKETEYAVMINGPWGVGKTHFWNERVKKRLEAENYKILYVSLYGLTSPMEIDRRLLFAQFPILKYGMMEAFTKLTKSGLDYFKIRLPVADLKANTKDRILCFDDLERISQDLKVSDVLGFINGYAEQDHRKVILIGNEDEINDERYKVVKEKLI